VPCHACCGESLGIECVADQFRGCESFGRLADMFTSSAANRLALAVEMYLFQSRRPAISLCGWVMSAMMGCGVDGCTPTRGMLMIVVKVALVLMGVHPHVGGGGCGHYLCGSTDIWL